MAAILKGCIFDLDGVIVDTARYHFLAWKRLAGDLGFEFTEKDNEQLKGVSRMTSLDILLATGNIEKDKAAKDRLAVKKNEWYIEYIRKLTPADILPGSVELLEELHSHGIKCAVGSASKNAMLILERLRLTDRFDVIIDGTRVNSAKPDPEVFVLAAREMGLRYDEVIVFEDAVAGVEAAGRAGMKCIGVGKPEALRMAATVVTDLSELNYSKLIKIYGS
ncbi:MAG: beta-phosphoglucomutase [Bacteroidales bacterium]|nr:beta-phosphoglucomutase [Bacteroidales bacterium]